MRLGTRPPISGNCFNTSDRFGMNSWNPRHEPSSPPYVSWTAPLTISSGMRTANRIITSAVIGVPL